MNKPIINRKTFESLENLGKAVVKDVAQQLTGNYAENAPDKPQILPAQQKAQIKSVETQNLARINQEIAEIRKKRERQNIQKTQIQTQEKKQGIVEKKKKESILAKLLKSRQGSKESMQRTSG